MTMQIPLTKGFIALVDDEDYHWLVRFRWHVGGLTTGHPVARTYIGKSPDAKTTYADMHRLIMGEPDGLQVDHRNGDSLDNRRDNLRLATPRQNMANSKVRANNKSGYRGVSWSMKDRRWSAFTKDGDKNVYLGAFKNPKDAAKVYDDAQRRIHGEFACLNFPKPGERSARN